MSQKFSIAIVVALAAAASIGPPAHAGAAIASVATPTVEASHPTKFVSQAEFEKKMAQLRRRWRGRTWPTLRRGRIVCHQLSRDDFYIVTGVDSELGGTFCHRH